MANRVLDPIFKTSTFLSDVIELGHGPIRRFNQRREAEHAQNLTRILSLSWEKCSSKGLESHRLHSKFSDLYIESARREDDPDIQEMWAELLVSELKEPSSENIRIVSILSRLSPESAKFIKRLGFFGSRLNDNSRDFMWEGRFANLLGEEYAQKIAMDAREYDYDSDSTDLIDSIRNAITDMQVGLPIWVGYLRREIAEEDLSFDNLDDQKGDITIWREPVSMDVVDFLATDGLIARENLFTPIQLVRGDPRVELTITVVCLSSLGRRFLERVSGESNVQ